MKVFIALQDTRLNGEDLALTPFLFLVNSKGQKFKLIGLGLCWFHYAFAISFLFNSNNHLPFINFRKYTK